MMLLAAHNPAFCSATVRRSAAARVSVSRPRVAALRPLAALPGSDALELSEETKADLPQWLTLAGYAASAIAARTNIGSFHLTANTVYSGLAWYTLAWGAMIVADVAKGGDIIGSLVGPLFLSVTALNGFGGRVAPFETATFLFGYLWLKKLPQFENSRWFWMATLVAAIYKGVPAEWLVGALGVSSLWNLVQQYRATNRVRYQDAAFAALAAFAFYKQVELPVAVTMMAAQMVASAIAA